MSASVVQKTIETADQRRMLFTIILSDPCRNSTPSAMIRIAISYGYKRSFEPSNNPGRGTAQPRSQSCLSPFWQIMFFGISASRSYRSIRSFELRSRSCSRPIRSISIPGVQLPRPLQNIFSRYVVVVGRLTIDAPAAAASLKVQVVHGRKDT